MAPDLPFIAAVDSLYAGLVQLDAHDCSPSAEPRLGGSLLYAGELDAGGRALLVAGNIAGAASVAATADPDRQKQAIREGVVDFLVTSLDEALRILKNEIRKRETVAVCVALAPDTVEREMLARGVLPNLVSSSSAAHHSAFLAQGARAVESIAAETRNLVAWTVASAPALWLPRLDAIAIESLDTQEAAAGRWLRLAPRYLGRLARNQRLLRCNEQSAQKFLGEVQRRVERSEIGVGVEIQLVRNGETWSHRFAPPVGD